MFKFLVVGGVVSVGNKISSDADSTFRLVLNITCIWLQLRSCPEIGFHMIQ